MQLKEPRKLIIALALSYGAGFLGALVTVNAIPVWYEQLVKPSFSPPNWLFAPAWNVLYALMASALYLVWREGTKRQDVRLAVNLFWLHLALNALWSILFFGLHNPLLALFDIIILWALILLLTVKFYPINKWSAFLMLPYLAWVSFALLLNFSIWQLNS